jgi:hypothetical protein
MRLLQQGTCQLLRIAHRDAPRAKCVVLRMTASGHNQTAKNVSLWASYIKASPIRIG